MVDLRHIPARSDLGDVAHDPHPQFHGRCASAVATPTMAATGPLDECAHHLLHPEVAQTGRTLLQVMLDVVHSQSGECIGLVIKKRVETGQNVLT